MKTFTTKGYTFLTTDRWEGLWAPLQLLGSLNEPDGHHPDHKQVYGTCQAQGQSQVRRFARQIVDRYIDGGPWA